MPSDMTCDTINNDVTIAGGAEGAPGRIDKYELVRELGEGGFGAVYLARDTVAKSDVAIKGLPPEVKHNAAELESIRRNFALVKRLRHPNIVAVTDLHQAVAVRYASKEIESKLRVYERDTMVVMDYAPGVTLAQWRRRFPDGKVPPDKAIAVARQVASALDYAHGQKVLHRDVKPANVMVDAAEDGRLVARVLDFGLAAEIRSSMGRVSREIRDTSGTRPYMAPEQWKGDRQGPATDQYALAAMFYELVVGEVPFASVFDCGDTAVMRLAVTTDAPKMPASLPKTMRKALAVALSKKPDERFATCGDFVTALERRGVSLGGGRISFVTAALFAALAGGAWWFAWRDAMPAKPAPPAIAKPAPPATAKPAPAEPEPVSAPPPVAPVPVPEISLAPGKAPASDPAPVAIAKPAPPAIAEPAPSATAKPAPAELEPVSAPPPVAPVPVHEISLAPGKALASDPAPVAIAKPAPSATAKPAPAEPEPVSAPPPVAPVPVPEVSLAPGKAPASDSAPPVIAKTVPPAIAKPAPAELEPVSAPPPVAPVPVPEVSLAPGKAPASDSAPPVIAKTVPPAQPSAPPTLTVRAELNGREASGARMQTMSGHVLLPYDWPDRLTRDRSYGPYLVQYSDGCNDYYGSFKIDGVNWNGHTNITVRLDATWPEDVRRPAQGIRSWAF